MIAPLIGAFLVLAFLQHHKPLHPMSQLAAQHQPPSVVQQPLPQSQLSLPLQPHLQPQQQREVTPVTLALSPREVRIIKCNGNLAKLKQQNVYGGLHPEYLSQIVVLGKSGAWSILREQGVGGLTFATLIVCMFFFVFIFYHSFPKWRRRSS